MKQFKSRKPNRLKNYNYSVNSYYFITICSFNRENIFGEYKNINVVGADGCRPDNNIQIELTKIGQIIDNQWNDIPNKYNNVELDTYIIMPNHMHGILIVNNNGNNININKREETSPSPTITISDIICSLKSTCTMAYLNHLKQNNICLPVKIWQRSFYDHVIRTDKSCMVTIKN